MPRVVWVLFLHPHAAAAGQAGFDESLDPGPRQPAYRIRQEAVGMQAGGVGRGEDLARFA